MEDTDKRLSETSAQCLAALEAWNKDRKDVKTRGELQESVHELRKVASRLEIEMAISERDAMAQKPIPIPSHRDSNRKIDKNDDRGNRAPASEGGAPKRSGGQRRGGPRKASSANKEG